MLLLTDQREVHAEKPLVFDMLGTKETFKYCIKTRDYYKLGEEASLQFELTCSLSRDHFRFAYPQPRAEFVKHLGAWLGWNLRHREACKHMSLAEWRANPGVDMWSTDRADIKKLKSSIYLCTRRVAQIIQSWAHQDFLNGSGITKETWRKVEAINYRINTGRKALGSQHLCTFHDIHKYGDRGVFDMLVKDLSVYSRSMSRYILERYHVNTDYNFFLKSIPYYIRNCKYGFTFLNAEGDYLEKCHKIYGKPMARFNWFVLNVILHVRKQYDSDMEYFNSVTDKKWAEERIEDTKFKLSFLEKLYHSDISVWRYFKKAQRFEKKYSSTLIHSMLDTINDGQRIYQQSAGNLHGIKLKPIDGSAMNMIRNALFNHNQDRELSKLKKFDSPDFTLHPPLVKLPEWIEKIRIQTAHEMIRAGIECEHCIGNYTHSRDIFVREGNICAEIKGGTFSVAQCYDVRDTITKASKNLRARLERDLKPMIKYPQAKQEQANELVNVFDGLGDLD